MNYNSINEIFSAGLVNMTCLLLNSGSYDGGTFDIPGVDYFKFNDNTVSHIYAHGDSYWGIGSDTSHLKVNTRDARMCSLYREEGTLFSYYKFLKIRWEGWSHYSSSGPDYQLKYDLIFWETGDISLHMIEVPLLCYDGAFEFLGDRTYNIKRPSSAAPDITFQYYDDANNFEIKYTPLDLLAPYKLLIKDFEDNLYTVEKVVVNEETNETADELVSLTETDVNSLLFKTRGFVELPAWDLIKYLDTPSVLSWSDSQAFPLSAIITGTPPKQYIECTADLSDGTVLGIKALNAEYAGEVTEQHSFDGELFSEEVLMSEFLTCDLAVLFEGLTEDKTITFRFWLSDDATLTTFIMTYRNGDDDNA